MRISQDGKRLIIEAWGSKLWIDPWGESSVRVRMTQQPEMDNRNWVLTEEVPETDVEIKFEEVDTTDPWYKGEEWSQYHRKDTQASLTNGKLTVKVSTEGWLSFYNQKGELLCAEYWSNRDRLNRYSTSLRIEAREMRPIMSSSDYRLTARFEAFDDEKIYGCGQYQDGRLNKKGCLLELASRNGQSTVPFFVSSRGYGFLWNDPSYGSVTFGANVTEWHSVSTRKMDYFITCGDTPAEIEEHYSAASGRAPKMPEYGLGFWQCKLRYRNQEELLNVAREYKKRGLPLDVIVIDFFHWTRQGDFKFEKRDWPDPDAMVKELKEMGIETVVSVWPTVDEKSENSWEMADKGYLVKTDRGNNIVMTWMGNTTFFDATHPGAQKFVWERCKEGYYKHGIRCFWLDESEPEYGPYDFDLYRYHAGPAHQCLNTYCVGYAKAFYDGLKSEGETEILSLARCTWAGGQKYGVLTWSGDISSTWRAMKEQLPAGLNMAMAGIPWWTCDLGGFMGGNFNDPDFHELLVRWFAWGCFLPVFRMHGERSPWHEREEEFINGVRQLTSGQDNEIWSFGEKNYEIMKEYLFIRERMRDYVRTLMIEASAKGAPIMRPLFYDFPEDKTAWETEDCYMFGPDMLVSPVTEPNVTEWSVYLPSGTRWVDAFTKKTYEGGQRITVPAPLSVIPVMLREGCDIEIYREGFGK